MINLTQKQFSGLMKRAVLSANLDYTPEKADELIWKTYEKLFHPAQTTKLSRFSMMGYTVLIDQSVSYANGRQAKENLGSLEFSMPREALLLYMEHLCHLAGASDEDSRLICQEIMREAV